MTLLDKQQRAMLAEMGIRVWQPEPEPVSVVAVPVKPVVTTQSSVAINTVAGSAVITTATAPFDSEKQAVKTPVKTPVTTSVTPATTPAAPHADAWRVGALQTLYGNPVAATPSRWLLLLEQPEAALQNDFDAMAGDAGKLLDNMLRAAKLHTTAVVMLAPLVRSLQTGNNLAGQLTTLLASANANVVLVMGRLAAQAVLQSTEPLVKLRGHTHDVHGQRTVITLDPAYLLRNPLDKAKAWDDLCLALQVVVSNSD